MSGMASKKQIFFNELCVLLDSESWSGVILKKAEKAAGFIPNHHRILFPEGESQIVQEFESWLDNKMLGELVKYDKPEKVREQIAFALEKRIIEIVPKNIILRNCSFFMLPNNILAGTKSACQTCDAIWKYAGDRSTDFNYYTKRGLLLPVYYSAKSYYITDNSHLHEKTREFIKNALDNIINIASFKNRINAPKMEDIPIIRLFS